VSVGGLWGRFVVSVVVGFDAGRGAKVEFAVEAG